MGTMVYSHLNDDTKKKKKKKECVPASIPRFFYENLVVFNKARLHEVTLTPPVNNVRWWKAAFEWGSVECSRRIFIVRKMTERREQRYCGAKATSCWGLTWDAGLQNTVITGDESWVYGYDPKPVIFLTLKIRRKH